MSSIAWILLGLLIICPHNDAAKSETLCTCQQSGLGPFESSSHSSHHSGHGTFGESESNTETSEPNSQYGLGNHVTQAISSAEETAGSGQFAFGTDTGGPMSFGNSGSSSNQHVSVTYEDSGPNNFLGHGLKQFSPYSSVATGSEATKSSHFGKYGTGTIVSGSNLFGLSEPNSDQQVPVSVEQSSASSYQLSDDLVGPSRFSSAHFGSTVFGPSEASSGTSTLSGLRGSRHYVTHTSSSTISTANTRPSYNDPDGEASGQLEHGPFRHSGSSSNQHVSITFGQSGQSEPSEHYISYNSPVSTSATGAAEIKPSQFEIDEEQLNSGTGTYGQSEPSSDQQVTTSVGISDAGSDQPESSQIASDQFGAEIFEPSEANSKTSMNNELLGSGHYVTHTTSTAQKTKSSHFQPDGDEPLSSGTGIFVQSEPNLDQHETISVGISSPSSVQSEKSPVGSSGSISDQFGTEIFEPSEVNPETSMQNGSLGYGHYGTYTTSSTAQMAEAAEAKPFKFEPFGGESLPSGTTTFGQSEPSSNQQVTVSNGIFGANSDQPESGPVRSSGSISNQLGAEIYKPSGANSGMSVQNGSLGSDHYVTYSTYTPQTEEAATKRPSLSGSDGEESGSFEAFENDGSSPNQEMSISLEKLGHAEPSGQKIEEYISYNNSVAAAEEATPSLIEPNDSEPHTSGSGIFGQSEPSSNQQATVSVETSSDSSGQAENGPIESSGPISNQFSTEIFKPSEENSVASLQNESLGSGNLGTPTTSSTTQTAEATETRPFLNSPARPQGDVQGPLEPGPFYHSGYISNQNMSVNFLQLGKNKTSEPGQGQYDQHSNSVSAAAMQSANTEPIQFKLEGGDSVVSGSSSFGQLEPSSDQGVTISFGISTASSNQPGRGPVEPAGYNSIQNETRPLGPSGASTVTFTSSGSGQYTNYGSSPVGLTSETEVTGLLDNRDHKEGSSLNQHMSKGPSKSFGEDKEQYNQYGNTVAAETKPNQFEADGEGLISTQSVPFGQAGSNSNQQISGSVGQYAIHSDQLGNSQGGPSEFTSLQNEAKLSGPAEASSGTFTSSELFGSEPYLQYTPSSVGLMAEETETRPSTTRPSKTGLGSFGQLDSSSNQDKSVTFGQLVQSKSFGEDIGQYNKNGNLVSAETKPSQFQSEGGEGVFSGSVPFGQSGSNSYQQMYGSIGQDTINSDHAESGNVRPLEFSSVQNGAKIFGPAETNKQGLGSFGKLDSSSNQDKSVTFGQLGQSKSFGEGIGQYNQYGNLVSEETKPSQFQSDGGEGVFSGSVPFGQSGYNSYQQISGSLGQDTISSDHAESGHVRPSEFSSFQNGAKIFGPAETNKGGQGSFGQSDSSSNQHKSVTFGQHGQSKSFGEGSGQNNQYGNLVSAETKPSQLQSEGGEGVLSGSVPFGKSGYNSYQQMSGSIGQDTISSDPAQSGNVRPLELSSVQNGAKIFGPPETNKGGLGSFGQSDSSSNQDKSVTFGQLGQSKSFGEDIGQYNQYGNLVSAETKPSQFQSEGGEGVLSASVPFGQSGSNSYQQISDSLAQDAISSDHAESGHFRPSEFSSVQKGAKLFGPAETNKGGLGSFGQLDSSSNQDKSVTFGQLGQSKSFGEGTGQYNQYGNLVSAETKPSQFQSEEGELVLSGSFPFGQPGSNSYQQISGLDGQYAIGLDNPGSGHIGLSELSSIQNGAKLFEPDETSSGVFTSSGSLGSRPYLNYTTSSIGLTPHETETRPSDIGSDMGELGSFRQPGSSLNQAKSITFGQPVQSKSFNEGNGQYNQYNNLVPAETKPSQFESVGGEGDLPGYHLDQPESNSYQQIFGSDGQYASSSDKPISSKVGPSEFSSSQKGGELFRPSEANSEIFTSSGSLEYRPYLDYTTSSVGPTAEEIETRPTPFGPDRGGLNPFDQPGSISNQVKSTTFGQLGQSKSFGENIGQNQYGNSVAADTKPFVFESNGGGEVSSGSVSFNQPGSNSYPQISSSIGQYAISSDQPGSVHVDHGVPSKFSSVQDQVKLSGPEEASSGTFTSSGSFGSGPYLSYTTSSVGPTAHETETRPSFIGPDKGGLDPFRKSGSSSNQYESTSFGQVGQSKPFGDGIGQYNHFGDSVAAQKKPLQFESNEGSSVSSFSVPFGQSKSDLYQKPSGLVGQYLTSSDQSGSNQVGPSDVSSVQNGPVIFGPSETNLGTSTQSGSFGLEHSNPSAFDLNIEGLTQSELGPSGPSGNSLHHGQFEKGTDYPGFGLYGSSRPSTEHFGPSGSSVINAPSSIVQSAETAEGMPSLYGSDEGKPNVLGFQPSGNLGYSSNQQEPITYGQSGQNKLSKQGLGHYNQYSNSVAAETIPLKFESAGEGAVSPESVLFGQPGPISYQQIPGSSGQSSTVPDQYGSGLYLPSVSNLVQPGFGLFEPSNANLGTSTSGGAFGPGNYLQYSSSAEKNPSSIGSDGAKLDPLGYSGYSSNQQAFSPFGHIKSSEQKPGQYIPFSNSAVDATAGMIKSSPFDLNTKGLTQPELGPSGPSGNSLDHGQFEKGADYLGFGPYGSSRPSTDYFDSSGSLGLGPYRQYAATSAPLTAEGTETEPSIGVKNEGRPGPIASYAISGPYTMSPQSVVKTASLTRPSVIGSSEGASKPSGLGFAGLLGLSPIQAQSYNQTNPTMGAFELSEPSGPGPKVYVPFSTSAAEEQTVPYPYNPHREVPDSPGFGPFGQSIQSTDGPKPELFGQSGSSAVLSVPNGPFGLGPGFYIPYRTAGGAVTAASQTEPSWTLPYRGEAEPSPSFIGSLTPSSYEPPTNQSTLASESNEILGSGLNNSYTPSEETTTVTASPVDKKAVLKSASRLSTLLSTARTSTSISYLLASNGFSPTSLTKVISYLLKSVPEAQPGLSGNETLLQTLLEVIASLMHILSSASIGKVGNCPASSLALVGQSVTHALGS